MKQELAVFGLVFIDSVVTMLTGILLVVFSGMPDYPQLPEALMLLLGLCTAINGGLLIMIAGFYIEKILKRGN